MNWQHRQEKIVLFSGDLVAVFLSLWLALAIRNMALPTLPVFLEHAIPFSFIFGVWFIVFFVSDFYGKQTSIFRTKLTGLLLRTQLVNSVIAVLFFYLIPYFGITPKTILFIELVLSFILLLAWRGLLFEKIYKPRRDTILFLCDGKEVDELVGEMKNNQRYNVRILTKEDLEAGKAVKPGVAVINTFGKRMDDGLEEYYKMFLGGTTFVGAANLYEAIFERVPLGLINERWFLENISNSPKPYYDFFKRAIDVSISLLGGTCSLVLYPLVYLAIKMDDGGVLFSIQERVGEKDKKIKLFKFRTMSIANDSGKWGTAENKVTRIGKFMRKTRIDELPQFWNVLRGEISLIGPRPEFEVAVSSYEKDIPFYQMRHIIKPGLSGWAQIYHENHPHHNTSVAQTSEKLSYDLFYVKNRSLFLDINIILKTLKTFLSAAGK